MICEIKLEVDNNVLFFCKFIEEKTQSSVEEKTLFGPQGTSGRLCETLGSKTKGSQGETCRRDQETPKCLNARLEVVQPVWTRD